MNKISKINKLELDLTNYIKGNEIDKAEKTIQEILNIDPDNLIATRFFGVINLIHYKNKESWKIIKKVFDSEPENSENWFLFIESLFFAEKYDDALSILDIAKSKGLSGERIKKAENALKQVRHTKEISIIKNIKYFDADNSGELEKEINIVDVLDKRVPKQYEIEEIMDLLKFNDFKTLEKKIGKFLVDYPKSPLGWEIKGTIDVNNKSYEDAIISYSKADKMIDGNDLLKINIATCYLKLNENKKAIKILNNIKKDSPQHKLAQNYLDKLDSQLN